MYQIDSSGVATSLPTPAAAATPGYFTGGNPATGTPATVLDADWFNAVMMELLNVVTAAGLTPSKTTDTQVRDAIAAMYAPLTSFASSIGVNGYQKIPGGLIIQWGSTGGVSSSSAAVPVAFPLAFPNACLSVVLTGNTAGSGVMTAVESPPTKTSFQYGAYNSSSTRSPGVGSFYIAIGN